MRRSILAAIVPTFLLGCGQPEILDQAYSMSAERLSSLNRTNRDIDLTVLILTAPRRSAGSLEFGIQAGLLNSSGTSSERGVTVSVDANAVFGGGYARFSPEKRQSHIRPFVEVGIAGVVTDRNWPKLPSLAFEKTRFYTKFDARMGAAIPLSEDTDVEAALVLNHISNGRGVGPDNLNFDGAGLSLGLRRRW